MGGKIDVNVLGGEVMNFIVDSNPVLAIVIRKMLFVVSERNSTFSLLYIMINYGEKS